MAAYRVVLVTNPFLVACVYVFEAPLSVMFLVCHLVLVNILSCRVYRNMKLGTTADIAVPKNALPSSGNGMAVFLSAESTISRDRKPSVSSGRATTEFHGIKEATRTTYEASSIYANETEAMSSFTDMEKAQIPRAF